ncbi:hypothetical protein ACWCQK_41025 [Streptomyces sp. NPDC002306]
MRQVTGWITRHPNSRTAEETLKLSNILARCPDLDPTAGHAHVFAEMMTARTGHQHRAADPTAWLRQFTRLRIRYETRTNLQLGLLQLACSIR